MWPAGGFAARPCEDALEPPANKAASAAQTTTNPSVNTPASAVHRDVKAVHAPIPGVIVGIEVEVGQRVEVGQTLCVLEAMKMKNAIRAPRAGQIAAIVVATGEHVKHHDLLMEYAD